MCTLRNNNDKEFLKAITALFAIVFVFSILYTCVSCSPRIYPANTERHTDTIVKVQIVHDTVSFEIPVEKEIIVTKDTSSHLQTTYAQSDAVVTDGRLYHSLESIPQKVYIPVTKEVHDTTIITKEAETIIKEVEREFTKWESFSMMLGWILGGVLLLVIILFVIIKFLKR